MNAKHATHERKIVAYLARGFRATALDLNRLLRVSNSLNRVSSARAKGAPIRDNWLKTGPNSSCKIYFVPRKAAREWLRKNGGNA